MGHRNTAPPSLQSFPLPLDATARDSKPLLSQNWDLGTRIASKGSAISEGMLLWREEGMQKEGMRLRILDTQYMLSPPSLSISSSAALGSSDPRGLSVLEKVSWE